MQVTATPDPFTPGQGYEITVSGGVPPYHYKAAPVPPNPQGVTITPAGSTCHVDCPVGTPSGTPVKVVVTDSSVPPQKVACQPQTA